MSNVNVISFSVNEQKDVKYRVRIMLGSNFQGFYCKSDNFQSYLFRNLLETRT